MTITVAFGTSTPTSITVVETSTCTSFFWKAFMTLSFSSLFKRPCNNPTDKRFSKRLEIIS